MPYLKNTPYRIVAKFDRQASAFTFWAEVIKPPNPRWGLIIGDIAHNYRSALDHLAWQLALKHSAPDDPSRSAQWPITDSLDKFNDGRVQRMLASIDPAIHADIERLQPYNAPEQAYCRPLAALRDLSNTDKHRLLNTCVGAMVLYGEPKMEFNAARDISGYGDVEMFWGGPIHKKKLAVVSVKTTGPDPRLEMKIEVPVGIAFGDAEPTLHGRIIENVLKAIRDEVRRVVRTIKALP
jgi:hypothetical protein